MKHLKQFEIYKIFKTYDVGDWVLLDLDEIDDHENKYQTDASRVANIISFSKFGSLKFIVLTLNGEKSHIPKNMILKKLKPKEVKEYKKQYKLEVDVKNYNL